MLRSYRCHARRVAWHTKASSVAAIILISREAPRGSYGPQHADVAHPTTHLDREAFQAIESSRRSGDRRARGRSGRQQPTSPAPAARLAAAARVMRELGAGRGRRRPPRGSPPRPRSWSNSVPAAVLLRFIRPTGRAKPGDLSAAVGAVAVPGPRFPGDAGGSGHRPSRPRRPTRCRRAAAYARLVCRCAKPRQKDPGSTDVGWPAIAGQRARRGPGTRARPPRVIPALRYSPLTWCTNSDARARPTASLCAADLMH